ncbi:CFEM-domain-containing protein, partial [Thozetella sp. PMI_491]
MKYSVGLLFALAAFTSAQSLSDIPQCAQPCITAAIKSSTTCGETDYKCACQNEDKLVAGATSCVISACGADVALNQVLPATQKFCAAILA